MSVVMNVTLQVLKGAFVCALAVAAGSLAGCAAEAGTTSQAAVETENQEAGTDDMVSQEAQATVEDAIEPESVEESVDALVTEAEATTDEAVVTEEGTGEEAETESVAQEAACAQVVALNGNEATLAFGTLAAPDDGGEGWGFIPDGLTTIVNLEDMTVASSEELKVGDVVILPGVSEGEAPAPGTVMEVAQL